MSTNLVRLLEWHRRKIADDFSAPPSKPISSVAIIGVGLMGVEIAAANLHCGLRVLMTDKEPAVLAAAPDRIASELAKYRERAEGLIPSAGTAKSLALSSRGDKPLGSLNLLELTTDETRLAQCDLILETIVENPAVKRQVYGRLEPRLAAGSLLATNTSTIPIGELAAELARPERFCGIHFCHPVHINPLVEIIPGPRTDHATMAAAVDYAKMLGKMPLVVEDGPGFLVNRLLMRYTEEAMHLLLDGAGIEQVDNAAAEFGMALGPLRIMDEIGLDTSLSAGKVLHAAFPGRVASLPLLPLLVKRKQLGQKSGGGFYDHSQTPLGPNAEALAIIEHYAKRDNPPSPEAILHRMLLSMILEATLILQEKKLLDPREVDLCMICGLGFPAGQGGLLHWADEIGMENILAMLKIYESLGQRFQPTPMLRELAFSKQRFYD